MKIIKQYISQINQEKYKLWETACEYCGRFLTATELKQDKKAVIILIIVEVIQIIYIKVGNQGILQRQHQNKKKTLNQILNAKGRTNLEKCSIN